MRLLNVPVSKLIGALLCIFISPAYSALPDDGEETFNPSDAVLQRLKVAEDITPHTTELLGERVDLSTGSLSFSHTDFVIPGPAGLDIPIIRSWRGGRRRLKSMSMGDWELELPRIQAYAIRAQDGTYSAWQDGKACSGNFFPVPVISEGGLNSQLIEPHEYFNGVDLIVPGRGVEKILADSLRAPAVSRTKSNWTFRCMTKPDGTEGFLGYSPDGLEYTFDVRKTKIGHTIKSKPVPVYNLYMYASKVKDRFGNFVNYEFQDSRITISSSDGRSVAANVVDGVVSSIVSSKGTWNYGYENDSYGHPKLRSVGLPDGTSWDIDLTGANYGAAKNLSATSDSCTPSDVTFEASLVHPNGTKGIYVIETKYQGWTDARDPGLNEPRTTHCFISGSLVSKELQVPGGETYQWQYDYSENKGSAKSDSVGTAEAPAGANIRQDLVPTDIKTTTVHSPDGAKVVYQFLRKRDAFEGSQVAVEYYDTDSSTPLRREDWYYAKGTCFGFTGVEFDNTAPHVCGTKTTKQAVTEYSGAATTEFFTEYSQFNEYDTPTVIKEYNSVNSSWVKYARNSYAQYDSASASYNLINIPTKAEVSTDGQSWTPVSEFTYHSATGNKPYLPNESKRFDTWTSKNVDYHASGDLKKTEFNASTASGSNRWIEFSGYKFGEPQVFKIPDPDGGATPFQASRAIGDDALIDGVTDFEGVTKSYGYDAMGRLSLIDNPANWNDVVFSFQKVNSTDQSALGVAGTQYKRIMSKGDFIRTRYFDGLLRPVLESKKDSSDGTVYYQNRTFNTSGNITFQSYWSTSPFESQGVRKFYDGLQRLVSTLRTADSAQTKLDYLSGNRVKTTDPRGYATTVSYKAYGQPTQSEPVSIAAPEGVTTSLTYNIFGNLESITQDGQAEVRYYDSYQNLCRVVRPEFGDTVFSHTPAGELTWEARGLSLAGAGCQLSAVTEAQKIHYVYDDLGRLRQTLYPDATPNLGFDYTRNGLLQLLDTGDGANLTYDYNPMGLLDGEMLQVDGQTFTIGYVYNANGILQELQYPSGNRVSFNPDAFGRARKAGIYATVVDYYPNDMLWKFDYGNGLKHTTELNAIKLPSQRKDLNGTSGIFHQTAYYDKSLNITSLVDGIDSHYNLGMTYDGLDRLDTASGPWGAGSLNYDTLGNIQSMTLGAFQLNYNYDTSNRLDAVMGSRSYSFDYDVRGNVTNNGIRSFTFNLANQMVVSGSNSYQYDGHGKRVKSVSANGTEYSYYNRNGRLLYKYDSNGTVSEYIYLGDRLVAKNSEGPGAFAPTVAPTMSLPESANLNQIATVSWGSVPNATFYLLQQQKVTGHWVSVYNEDEISFEVAVSQNGNNNYRVAGCNAAGCGPFSIVKTVLVAPATPSSISVPGITDTDGSYTISWGSSSSATSYKLQEQINGGSWLQVASQSGINKAFSGRGNGTYAYRVQACNSSGCSGWKTSGSFDVLHPPGSPGSITIPTNTDTDGSYTISWLSVSTATSYKLQEQKNGGSWLEVANQSGISKPLSGRTNGTYAYRVQACNSSGCSGWRTSGSFDVLLPPGVPVSISAPSGTDTDGSYTVSWASSSTATTYTLLEQKDGGSWVTVAAQSGTSKALSGRGNGNYKYAVKACNASGCSGYRYSGIFDVLLPPDVPGSITVPTSTDTNGAYTISWSGSSTATSYTLREQKNGGSYVTVATQSGTSKALSGRGNGTYKYAVRACNASGCSGYRYSTTFDVLLPPTPPSLSAPSSDGDGTYTVSWGSSSTATSYTLQQKVGSGSWANAYSGTSRSKAYSGKAEGTYYYRVRACNASGCGSWSGTKTVVVAYPRITAFSVDPNVLLRAGTLVTASWQSVNATSCILKPGMMPAANVPVNGSQLIDGDEGDVVLTCSNGSKSDSASVRIIVKYGGGIGL